VAEPTGQDVGWLFYADHLDWHEVARLVQRGCPSRLAVRIAR
jgi:hypothetical protein